MFQKMFPSAVTNMYVSGRYKLQKQSAKYKIPIRNTCKLFIIYTVSSFCWLYLISYSQKKEKYNQKHFAPPFSLFQEIVISNFPLFQQNYTSYTKETAENIILKKQKNSFSESLYNGALPEIPHYIKGCQNKLNAEKPKQMSSLFREISIQNYIGRLKTNNDAGNGAYPQYETKGTSVQPKKVAFYPTTTTIFEPYLGQNINKDNSGAKQGTELLFFARKPIFPIQHQITENVASSWRLSGSKGGLYGGQIIPQALQVQNTNSYELNRVGASPTFGLGREPNAPLFAGWTRTPYKSPAKGRYLPFTRRNDKQIPPSNSYDTKNLLIGPELDLLPRRLDKVNKKIKVERVPRDTLCSLTFKPKLGQTEQLQLCNYSNIEKMMDLGFLPKYTAKENVLLPFGLLSSEGSFLGRIVNLRSYDQRQYSTRLKGVPTSGTEVKLVHQKKTNYDHICRTFSLYNPLSFNRTNSFTDRIIDSRLQSGFNFPDAPIINKKRLFLKKDNISSKKKILSFKKINYNSPTNALSSFDQRIHRKGWAQSRTLPVLLKDELSHLLPFRKTAPQYLRLNENQLPFSKTNYNAPDFAYRGDFALQSLRNLKTNQRHVLGKSSTQPHLQLVKPVRHRYNPFLELVYKQKPIQGYMSYDQTHGYVHLSKKSPAIYGFSKENSVSGFSEPTCTFQALTPMGNLRSRRYRNKTELWDITAQNLFASDLLSTSENISLKQEQPPMLTEAKSGQGHLNAPVDRSNLSDTNYVVPSTVDRPFTAQKHTFESSSSTSLSKFFVPVKRLMEKTQSLVRFKKILSFPTQQKIGRRGNLPKRPNLSSDAYPFVILNNNADIKTVSTNLEKNTYLSPETTSQQGHVPESFFGTPYLQLGERFTIEHLKGKNQMGLILNVHTGDIFTPDALSYSTSLGSQTLYGPTFGLLSNAKRLQSEDQGVRFYSSSEGSSKNPKQFPTEQLQPPLSFEKTGSAFVRHAHPSVFPFTSTGTSFTTVFGKKRLTKLRSKKMQSPVTNGRVVSQWSNTNIPYSKIETALKEKPINVVPSEVNKEIPDSVINLLPGQVTVESAGQPQVKLNTKRNLRSLLYFKRISGKANRHIINPFKYYNPGTKRDRNIEDTLLTLEGYRKSRLFTQTHTYYGGITVPFLPIEFLQSYPLSTIHDLALSDPHLQSILGGMRQRTESQRIAQNVTGASPINNEELKKNKSQNSSCSRPTKELLQDRYFITQDRGDEQREYARELEQISPTSYAYSPTEEGETTQHLRGSPEQSTNSGYLTPIILEQEQSTLFQGYNKESKKKRYRSTNCYPLRTLLAVRSQKSLSQIPIQPTDRTQYIFGLPTSMSKNFLWEGYEAATAVNSLSKGEVANSLPTVNPTAPILRKNTFNSKGTEFLYNKPGTSVIKGSGKTKGFYFENIFYPAIHVQNERQYFSDQPQQKYTNIFGRSHYNKNLKWEFRQSLSPITFSFSKILFFIVIWSSYKILAKGLLNPSGASPLSQSTQFLPAAFTEAIGLQTFQQKYRIITAKKTTQSFKNLAGAEKTLSELRDLIWTFHLVGTGGPRGEHSPFAPLPYIGGQAGQERTSVISKARNRFLLVGPPGTGKTLLVKTLAAEANVPVIVQPASQLRMIAGVENPVSALFRVARQIKPCIIFLDELDTLGNNLHTSTTGTTAEQKLGIRLARKYTYTLLLELDGLTSSTRDLLIIGATNRPETLNPALTRAGRFDTFINCNLPSQEQRFAVLSLYLSNQNKKSEKYKTSILPSKDRVKSTKNSLLSCLSERSKVFTSSLLRTGLKLTFGKSKDNSIKSEKSNQIGLPVLRQDKKEIEHFYINYIAQKCHGLSQASIGAVVNQSALESMLDFYSPALHTLKSLERAIESVKLLTPESTNRTVYQQAPFRSSVKTSFGKSAFFSGKKNLALNYPTEGQRVLPLAQPFDRSKINPGEVAKQDLRNNTQNILHQLGSYARAVRLKGLNRPYPGLRVGQELPESGRPSVESFKPPASFPHTQSLQFFVYKAYQTSSSAIFSRLTQLTQQFAVSNSSFARSQERTLPNLTINLRSTHTIDKQDLEAKILKGYAQHAAVNLYGATRPQNLRFSEVFGLCHNNLESNLLILKQLVLTSVNKTALTLKQKPLWSNGTAILNEGALLLPYEKQVERTRASMTGLRSNRSLLLSGHVSKNSIVEKVQDQNQQHVSSPLFAPTAQISLQTHALQTMQKQVREQIKNSDPLTTGWFRMYLSRPIIRYDNLSYIENKEYYPQNNYLLRQYFAKPVHSRNISTLAHSSLNFTKNKQQFSDQRYHGIEGKRKQQKFVSNKIWRKTIANKNVMQYSTPFDNYFNNQIQPIFLTIVAYFFNKMCVIFKENRELVDYCVYSKLRYSVIYEFSVTQICKKF